ncbi:LuxR C-terminal-related transcriptional regulator [Jiella flava]|nr:LuxR C-terminal-related transcriptional regulator [Jiella flava]
MARIPVALAQRLRPPRRPALGIDRPYLVGKVLVALDGQVVLLEAPAGFGKTELLAQVHARLKADGGQIGWLTLPDEPIDTAELAVEIAYAFGFSSIDRAVERPLETVLDMLATIPARRLVLFLDNLHPGVQQPVAKLLAALPDAMRLVVAARDHSVIPLSRLRMRGLVSELKAADFAFSRSEARRLLDGLTGAELEEFLTLCEGWPAIVGLAASRLRGGISGEERLAVLSGNHADFAAFLDEELLSALPPPILKLLDVGACLDEVPPELAGELAGLSPEEVRQAFVDLQPLAASLPSRPGWFALLPLLRSLLLQRVGEAQLRHRHTRAAAWFAAAGQIEKAVRYAADAGDFAFAANTIRAAGGVGLFLRAGYTVLKRLMQGLPADVVHDSPGLTLCGALVLAKEGQIHSARQILEELKTLAREGQLHEVPEAVIIHIDSLFDVYEDSHFEDEQVDWLERRVRSHRLRDTWERGWLHNHLCIAHTRRGLLRQAAAHAAKALECYREEGAHYAQAFMLIHLALVNLLGGRLTVATRYGREAEHMIQTTQWSDENLLSIARIPMAETMFRQGHVIEAASALEVAMPVTAAGEGWVDVFSRGYTTLARCRRLLDGGEAALEVVEAAKAVAEDRGLPRLDLSLDTLRVEILTNERRFEAASDWLARLPDPLDDTLWPVRRERRDAMIAAARLTLRRGSYQTARDALTRFVETVEDQDDGLTILCAEILLVEAVHKCGEGEAALGHLVAAIDKAMPENLIEPFSSEGEALKGVVRAIVRQQGLSAFSAAATEFVNRIIAVDEDGSFRSKIGILSPREGDVLALLARDLSNKEIARELDIGEPTVKFHVKNLFAKLGVGRRAMAVTVGRTLGLLH